MEPSTSGQDIALGSDPGESVASASRGGGAALANVTTALANSAAAATSASGGSEKRAARAVEGGSVLKQLRRTKPFSINYDEESGYAYRESGDDVEWGTIQEFDPNELTDTITVEFEDGSVYKLPTTVEEHMAKHGKISMGKLETRVHKSKPARNADRQPGGKYNLYSGVDGNGYEVNWNRLILLG